MKRLIRWLWLEFAATDYEVYAVLKADFEHLEKQGAPTTPPYPLSE